MNKKTIDRIRERCNKRLSKEYTAYDGHTIQNFMVKIIIEEFFKLLLEKK